MKRTVAPAAIAAAPNFLVIFNTGPQSHGKWTCCEGARVPLAPLSHVFGEFKTNPTGCAVDGGLEP